MTARRRQPCPFHPAYTTRACIRCQEKTRAMIERIKG